MYTSRIMKNRKPNSCGRKKHIHESGNSKILIRASRKNVRGPSFRSLYISRPAEEKFQVKVRLIEEMTLTLAGQSQRLSN